jgi:hypothetical protein
MFASRLVAHGLALSSTVQGCDCVLNCDLLLFPIHYKQLKDLAMAAVDLRNKRLLYWDSLSHGKVSRVMLSELTVLESTVSTLNVPGLLH